MTFGIDQTDPVPQDRNPVAAAQRVSAAENGHSAVRAEIDLRLWDIRLAAVLNFLDIARSHGEHRDWTSDHAAQIRAAMAIGDAAVAGEGPGIIPQGFGAPVRTALALTFIKAQAKSAAAHVGGDAAGAEGGQS
jgi:hypothetical protein